MVKTMSLVEAIHYQQNFLSNVQIGNILGVTADQIYKYASKHTLTCGDDVVDAFYDNFDILLDYYESEAHYTKLRRLRNATKETSD